MTLTRSLLPIALALPLMGCEQLEGLIGDKDTEEPDTKQIKAPPAPMDLKISDGEVSVVAIKDGDTSVQGSFDDLSGSFRFEDGALQSELTGTAHIAISSWDSGLEERDKNITSIFFEGEAHPSAKFALTGFDGVGEEGIAVGEEAEGTVTGRLTLHGASVDLETKMKLRRTADSSYHIDTVEPFEVSVEKIGMKPRMVELIQACGHQSVEDAVQINVSVSLVKGKGEAAPDQATGGTKRTDSNARGRTRTGVNRGAAGRTGGSDGSATRGGGKKRGVQ